MNLNKETFHNNNVIEYRIYTKNSVIRKTIYVSSIIINNNENIIKKMLSTNTVFKMLNKNDKVNKHIVNAKHFLLNNYNKATNYTDSKNTIGSFVTSPQIVETETHNVFQSRDYMIISNEKNRKPNMYVVEKEIHTKYGTEIKNALYDTSYNFLGYYEATLNPDTMQLVLDTKLKKSPKKNKIFDNFLVNHIASLILCLPALPITITGIVLSVLANKANKNRDFANAMHLNRITKALFIASVSFSVMFYVFLLVIILGFRGNNT